MWGQSSTTLTIAFLGDTPSEMVLQKVEKFYFNDSLVVFQTSDSSVAVNYYRIHKISMKLEDDNPIPGDSVAVTDLSSAVAKVYPNPSDGELRILLEPETEVEVTVYSGTGQQLLRRRMLSSEPVDIRQLKPGAYFIKINDEHFKFIKR